MRNIKLLFSVLFCIVVISSKAQDFLNSPLIITDEAKENADFVIRSEKRMLQVVSPTKSILNVREVGSVINEAGIGYSGFYEYYDDKRDVKFIKGIVYDQLGNIVEKIRPSDLEDVSAMFAFFGDTRVKKYEIKYGNLPYTVEYIYEITLNGSFFIPDWMPVPSFRVGIEKSTYDIIIPKNIGLKYKALNFDRGVKKKEVDNFARYSMKLFDFKPIKDEERCPVFTRIAPKVLFTPINFTYDEWEGDLSDWKSFGAWNYKLIQGRSGIPAETVVKVKNLIKDVDDEYQKIRMIYEYMQSKTRYVSIQIGIGGWQPFEASVVDEMGYGDCKALSNYTKALLKAVGINSIYTVIGNGNYQEIKYVDFANFSQLNHAILCVPMEQDTVWLECTSQRFPYGYIGASNSNRYALLITPDGGKLASTPQTTARDNYQFRKADVKLSDDGSIEIVSETKYGALQFERVFSSLFESTEEQKKELYKRYPLAATTISDFSYNKSGYKKPEVVEKISMNTRNYAQKSGKRIFFKPNVLNQSDYIPRKTEQRKMNIEIRNPYFDVDTLNITLPDSYKNEYVPEEVSIISKFGKYNASFKFEEGKLIYIRRIEIFDGTFSPLDYSDFRKFYKDISKADRTSMILVKS